MRAPAGRPRRYRLFAYGTLVVPRVMKAVAGGSFTGTPAVLAGYACRLLAGKTYPGIVASPGDSTRGVLYPGLDRDVLEILDRFEDDFYERRVVLASAGTETLPAHAYVVPSRHRSLLSADPWRREVFERDHMEAFLATLDARTGSAPAGKETP